MATYCKAKDCNFPWSHSSRGHQCGLCHKFGHGQQECFVQEDIKKLYDESVPLPSNIRCKLMCCDNRHTHTTDGHHCQKCNGRRHCIFECPLDPTNSTMVKCPMCRAVTKFKSIACSTIRLDVEIKCSVCYENTDRPVVFLECGHSHVCYGCFCNIVNKDMKNHDLKVAYTPEEGHLKAQLVFARTSGKIYTKISSQQNNVFYYRRDGNKCSVEYVIGVSNQSVNNFTNGYKFVEAK